MLNAKSSRWTWTIAIFYLFASEITTENTSDSDFISKDVTHKYQLPIHSNGNRIARDTAGVGIANAGPTPEDCDCGPHGNCSLVGGTKFCTCEENYGEKAYDVAEPGICHPCYCGTSVESSGCKFVGYFIKFCKCKKGYSQRHDYCIECDCGEHGKCSFDDGKKVCTCDDGFAQKEGVCVECDCGSDGNCSFVNGKKTCACDKNFAVKEYDVRYAGKCLPCNCGSELETNGCIFQGHFVKFCLCKKGYAQRSSQCVMCDCGPYGSCSFDDLKKVCKCDKGFIKKNGICEECDCGDGGECELDITGRKLCHCKPGYALKDNSCVECDCGKGEHECKFDTLGAQLCKCKEGFATKPDRRCHACNCQHQFENIGCTFNNNGQKACLCPTGYESDQDFCMDVNECLMEDACPFTTECKNTIGSFRCICKNGYRPHEDGRDVKMYGCLDVNECFEWNPCPYTDTTECVNVPGTYHCTCLVGYTQHPSGLSPQQSGCVSESSDWIIAAISVGAIFIFIIIGLLIAIFIRYRKRSSTR